MVDINDKGKNIYEDYQRIVVYGTGKFSGEFLEKYKSEIDRRDNTIMDLEIKNKAIINSIKLQIKQYNEQGGFARLVSKFVLKDFKY